MPSYDDITSTLDPSVCFFFLFLLFWIRNVDVLDEPNVTFPDGVTTIEKGKLDFYFSCRFYFVWCRFANAVVHNKGFGRHNESTRTKKKTKINACCKLRVEFSENEK